jgi:hypothetical protein
MRRTVTPGCSSTTVELFQSDANEELACMNDRDIHRWVCTLQDYGCLYYCSQLWPCYALNQSADFLHLESLYSKTNS